MTFKHVQAYMKDHRIDGWLVYDFRGGNSILPLLLAGKRNTTRRAALFIPATGQPRLLAHQLDKDQFANCGVDVESFVSWNDFRGWLAKVVGGIGTVAMEYSPGANLPVVSIVDAGTVELVRSLGVEVVSSANLIQVCVASWSPEAKKGHDQASREVARIKDQAFEYIRNAHRQNKAPTEYEVQQVIMKQFAEAHLETADPPIVAVNEHSGSPHFEVSEKSPALIKKGDWVLIDLWARLQGDENVYSDITWVGYCGEQVPAKYREVFGVVKKARDAAVHRAQTAWKSKEKLQGWQLDDAARNVIIDAGYQSYIQHRTGHSLSPGSKVHGNGFNLDNLETHDTREVLPRLGYTIEPGIYLPEFGVRLEINMYVDPDRGPITTSCVQEDVVIIT